MRGKREHANSNMRESNLLLEYYVINIEQEKKTVKLHSDICRDAAQTIRQIFRNVQFLPNKILWINVWEIMLSTDRWPQNKTMSQDCSRRQVLFCCHLLVIAGCRRGRKSVAMRVVGGERSNQRELLISHGWWAVLFSFGCKGPQLQIAIPLRPPSRTESSKWHSFNWPYLSGSADLILMMSAS